MMVTVLQCLQDSGGAAREDGGWQQCGNACKMMVMALHERMLNMDEATQILWDLGIDAEATLKRFCGDYDLLVEMLHEFASENLADGLPDALKKNDYDEVERIAHAVKGTSANLGLTDLSSRCDDVVQAVRSKTLGSIEALVSEAVASNRTALASIATL